MQLQGMAEDRPFHRALDDAFYTGKILSVLDMEKYGVYVSVDYYGLPETKENEYRLYFPEYTKFVSREFSSREDIMKDKDITDMVCLKCRRMLRKKIRWFPYGQRFYFCLGVCPAPSTDSPPISCSCLLEQDKAEVAYPPQTLP